MLASSNMLPVKLKQKCPKLNYTCTTILGNSLHQTSDDQATCRSLFYPRGYLQCMDVQLFHFLLFLVSRKIILISVQAKKQAVYGQVHRARFYPAVGKRP